MGAERRVPAAGRRAGVHDPAAAAERHRHAAHGSRVPAHAAGRADPLPPHARPSHAVADGHRPCRHRDRDGGLAQPRARRHGRNPRLAGPRRLHRQGVGVEGQVRRHDRAPDAASRHLRRLDAQCLHHGRHAVESGHRSLRAPAREGSDLSRQAPGQLGSGARHRDLRSGGREPRSARPHVALQVSAGRRRDLRVHRARRGRHHHPARDA